jgi:hypothetical protein
MLTVLMHEKYRADTAPFCEKQNLQDIKRSLQREEVVHTKPSNYKS